MRNGFNSRRICEILYGPGNARMRRGSEVNGERGHDQRLIELSLRNRFLVACATLLVVGLACARPLANAGRCHS